jgi:lipoate synthase
MDIDNVIIGYGQSIANTFLTKALKQENVQLLSVLRSLGIVHVVILQYMFLSNKHLYILYWSITYYFLGNYHFSC